jgi:hypothetical protein
VLADSVRTIADVARNYTPDLQAMIEGRGKLGEAARRMGQARDATVHALPVESRAAGVWTLFSTLTRAIYDDYFDIGKSQYSADETKTAAAKLHTRLADAEAHILQHGDDDQWIRRYEQSALRPLALEAQMHMRRNHLTVARPVWPSSPRFPQTSRVFYSGGQAVLGLLEAACLRTGLVLQRPSLAVSHASARWETLRSSHIAVFDFTGYSPVDFTTAGSVAAVAYELGMALAVGCPVVAIATEKQSTPFDLDIAPVRLPRSLEDTGGLSAALERAVYGIQRRECGNSLRATRTFLRQRIDGRDNAAVHEALRLMDESVDRDAVRLLRLAESVVGAEDSQYEVLFPAWPGEYPDGSRPRLFHVTPFGPVWAGQTMELVSDVCAQSTPPVIYVRGDRALEPDIVRSIWSDLCSATHIVADLHRTQSQRHAGARDHSHPWRECVAYHPG